MYNIDIHLRVKEEEELAKAIAKELEEKETEEQIEKVVAEICEPKVSK